MTKGSQASKAKIQRTIAAITIQDVGFEKFRCELLNGFDPQFDGRAETLSYQTRVNVSGFEVIETRYDSEGETLDVSTGNEAEYTLRVSLSLGIRLGEKGKLTRSETDPEVVAIIEANMYAYYDIHDQSILEDSDAIEEFVLQNAVFHAWPYWREFTSSSLQRLNLRKITLPFMKKASNRAAK